MLRMMLKSVFVQRTCSIYNDAKEIGVDEKMSRNN